VHPGYKLTGPKEEEEKEEPCGSWRCVQAMLLWKFVFEIPEFSIFSSCTQ
jgi:hypothetical protein